MRRGRHYLFRERTVWLGIRRLREFPIFYILCLRPIVPRLWPTCLPNISRHHCDVDIHSWRYVHGHMFGTGRITASFPTYTAGQGDRGSWEVRSCISSALPSLDRSLCRHSRPLREWSGDVIFTDVGVETHYVAVLYRLLTLFDFVVQTHGLGSTPVQSITSVHRRVSVNGMCSQIVGDSYELAFPLYFDSIAGPR